MKAKDFQLMDQQGKTHTLKNHAGKFLVLYFYPKDDTPGCTVEACDFRDHVGELAAMGAVVLGVSGDDQKSHQKFTKKFSLNFPLLIDEDAKLAKSYGAWGEKTMFGKTFIGVLRQTFLIDPNGQVLKHWDKVSVEGHVAEIVKVLQKSLKNNSKKILVKKHVVKKPVSKKTNAKKAIKK